MSGPARRGALAAVCGVLFLTFLDTTIVAVTLSSVQSDLGAGVTSLQWVVNGYALVFASLMLTAGTLGDRLGRRRVMVVGLVIFTAGSLLGALAPSVGVLIAARAVMGVGAAASEPGTLSVIRQLYPEAGPRARAIGAWAAVCGLALALGPVVGGALVGLGDWRAVFWFNVAGGALLLAGVVRFVPESADPQPTPLDLAGFVVGSGALAAVVFAVIGGENAGYRAWWVIALFVLSAVAAVGFLLVERRAAGPMLDLAYLRRPGFVGPLVVTFTIYFGVFSIFFFTALYLQSVVGYSGYRVAAQFGPMAAAMVVGALLTGRWVARAGPRDPMVLGCVLAAAGTLLTEHYLGHAEPFGALLLTLAVAGLGFGVAVVPVTSAVLGQVPAAQSGMAASMSNTSRQLGAVFGTAILGSVVYGRLISDLVDRLNQLAIPEAFHRIVIDAVVTGQTGAASGGADAYAAAYGPIVGQVIQAAGASFRAGLSAALVSSAALILTGAAIALGTVRSSTQTAALEGAPAAAPGA
jgi:EmrB/QacA subfamily drug resistance transporter